MEEQSENNYLVSTYTYQIEKALVDMEASIDQVTLIKDRETGSSLTGGHSLYTLYYIDHIANLFSTSFQSIRRITQICFCKIHQCRTC